MVYEEVEMKKVIGFCCAGLLALMNGNTVLAASGKCTVVDVDGNKMVVECPSPPTGFTKGTKIKIKSDKDKAPEGS